MEALGARTGSFGLVTSCGLHGLGRAVWGSGEGVRLVRTTRPLLLLQDAYIDLFTRGALDLRSSAQWPSRGNGSCRNFKPSLKGRGARQTASTRVVELSIRYMRLFRTSPTDLYSYGTCVNMSISSHPIRRGMRIMRSSRLVRSAARSTGSQHHHAHPIDPCRERRIGNGKASNHADPMHATRMQPAGSWAARASSGRALVTPNHLHRNHE